MTSEVTCVVIRLQMRTLFMLSVAALVIVSALATVTHEPTQRRPPLIPEFFTCNFTEFTAPLTGPPPYVNGVPQPPFKATRGHTFYDWHVKNLIEVRVDYCVNIFPTMNNTFPCTFWNINGTSYLTSVGAPALPSCCIFGNPWWPAPPDFLRNRVNSTWAGEMAWDATNASWWANDDIPPPTGPFLWSFRDGDKSPQLYSSFSFPGIEGWMEQNFFNVDTTTPPPASTWDLPAECLPVDKLPNCGFFGAQRPASFYHFFGKH
jgi:hypothetical protein